MRKRIVGACGWSKTVDWLDKTNYVGVAPSSQPRPKTAANGQAGTAGVVAASPYFLKHLSSSTPC